MTTADNRWAALLRDDHTAVWRPVLLSLASDPDRRALLELVDRGEVYRAVDRLSEQLDELCATRLPGPGREEERATLRAQLTGDGGEERFGVWAFFPWSGCAVRVLPAELFWELRTSRNRYKITWKEQRRLAELKIAIVGLSVGHATAITLALEGIGGELRLADFDTLALSNLNRLRTGVHNLGLNKAVLTAREIFELNPFARVEVLPRGIGYDTADEFLTSGGGVDLLIEECDDLAMKVFLRERARELRIPVLMETSDRGLVDVERFDQEPSRPLFHGLIGQTDSRTLRGLTTEEKVPFVLDILGAEKVSPRFAASLAEIDRTVGTWPQLASAVALGGALNADTARRMALGQLNRSGRFYVDLEKAICDDAPPLQPIDGGRRAAPLSRARAAPAEAALPPHCGEAEQLLEAACSAPSGGNGQAWRFRCDPDAIHGEVDEARAQTFLDFEGRASVLALGAAAESAMIEATALGLRTELVVPEASRGRSFELRWAHSKTVRQSALAALLFRRATNRRIGPRKPLPATAIATLTSVAEEAGARLAVVEAPQALEALGQIVGRGERLRLMHEQMQRELCGELRWSDEEAEHPGDGIHVRSLELSPTDAAGLRISCRSDAMQFLKTQELGVRLGESSEKAIRTASAFAAVWMPRGAALRYFEAGRVVQRLWLSAQLLGLSVQPMTALPFLFARVAEGAVGLDSAEAAELDALQVALERHLPTGPSETQVFLFRLAVLPAPSVASRRRPLADVLHTEGVRRALA